MTVPARRRDRAALVGTGRRGGLLDAAARRACASAIASSPTTRPAPAARAATCRPTTASPPWPTRPRLCSMPASTAAAHFVGHALGGLVGLALAQRRPDRLRSLTVVNGWAAAACPHRAAASTSGWRCSSTKGRRLRARPADLPLSRRLAGRNEARARRAGRGARPGELPGRGQPQGAHRSPARLRRRGPASRALKLPTFIVAARDDVLVPSAMSEELAAAIPGARLHVAPWGAHAINVTEPAAFNALLLDFLSCVTDQPLEARSRATSS